MIKFFFKYHFKSADSFISDQNSRWEKEKADFQEEIGFLECYNTIAYCAGR
jgi:hypothetical protein